MIKSTTLLALLLFATVSFALDPPVKMWEKWYYTSYDAAKFYDIDLTNSLNLLITGTAYDYSPPAYENYVAMLMNLSGDILWEVDYSWYGAGGNSGEVLADGSFIITGGCYVHQDSTYGLFLMKIDQDGSTEWTKVYDYPGTTEEGYGITCLPDGGFAVCGRVHGVNILVGQTWLLRTDANGDTLWTETWGTANANYGTDVLFNNDEICLLALGEDDTLTTYGTHLLFFNSEGDYLRGTSQAMTTEPSGICAASDGGYTFTNTANPRIWHLDSYGNLLWWYEIYNYGIEEGHDIIRTMDSGYLFCGWGGQWPEPSSDEEDDCSFIPDAGVDTGSTQDAWLVKFDVDGNQQWEFKNETGHDNHYYSVVQLPEGGYIACGTWGGSGYLARFAPETGIAEPDPILITGLEISPNPCSSLLSLRFSPAESGAASIRIYDLSGRLVDTAADAVFPAGENTIEWAVPEEVSSGCYLIQYNSAFESVSERCVLIN